MNGCVLLLVQVSIHRRRNNEAAVTLKQKGKFLDSIGLALVNQHSTFLMISLYSRSTRASKISSLDLK